MPVAVPIATKSCTDCPELYRMLLMSPGWFVFETSNDNTNREELFWCSPPVKGQIAPQCIKANVMQVSTRTDQTALPPTAQKNGR